jgi:hypothetical protein
MKARILTTGILSALLITGALTPVVAQTQSPGGPPGSPPARERPLPGRHIEGRIAFMRAELKITDAQQAHWDRVAAARRPTPPPMPRGARPRRPAPDNPASALERIERRAQMVELQAASAKSFAGAFKPLYDSFTDDQRKSADELFERRGPGRGGWRR